jgi:hypothetical protein
LQKKVSVISTVVLMIVIAMSTVNLALAATASTSPIQGASASGNGWINPQGKRDDFSFSSNGGTLKQDGWRYNPHAQASFTGKDLKANQLIQVWSTKVWRFKVDSVDSGKTAIIAGIASVKIGQQELRGNWWFRITAKDGVDNKDVFMIQLWRPTGAVNTGGWSPQDFKADKPGSLHLNAEAFYHVQGILKGGNIVIKL